MIEEDKGKMFKRPFEVSFKTPVKEKNIILKIKGNMGNKIYNSSVFFEAAIDQTKVFLEALLYPQNDPTVDGETIARAIVNDPKILLADEPTGALDTKTSDEIMELFKMLNKNGTTVIIVTHDIRIAEACDRIIRIEDGAIFSSVEL